MKRNKVIAAATTGLVSLSLFVVYTAYAGPNGNANEKAEVQQFLNAPTNLTQAIAAAEGETSGKAIGAEFELEDKTALYEITTFSGDVVKTVEIDPATGKVVNTQSEGFLSKLIRTDDDYAGVDRMTMTLSDVIANAEAQRGGKVMEVEFEGAEDNEPAVVEIEIAMADGSTQEFVLNPSDGSLKVVTDDTGETESEDK